MNDWMRPEEAWLYMTHRKEAVKGTVVHTAYNSNGIAWFVPDGGSIYDGYSVGDMEGVANAEGVWYTYEIPYEVVKHAMCEYWKDRLNQAEYEVRNVKRELKCLGVKTDEEDGAE